MEFVRLHLGPSATGMPTAQGVLMAVARSVESPLVKALLSLRQDIAAAGLPLRLILAQLDHDALPETWEQDLGPLACDVRWARRPRLIEAHEQLVLGPETCWIGDCMRRDPAKCDAFESYVEDCGEAAGCATVSFERLWVASEPIASAMAPSPIAMVDALSNADQRQVTVGTRH